MKLAMKLVGLRVNTKKSATLAIIPDGRNKRWICDRSQFVRFQGDLARAMEVDETYRYLGLVAGALKSSMSAHGLLEVGLEHISKAPLKLTQKLRLLTDHLLPKLTHSLVLAEKVIGGQLRKLETRHGQETS